MFFALVIIFHAHEKVDEYMLKWCVFFRARLEIERLRLRLSFAVDWPSWSVPKAAEIKPRLFSICSQSTQLWPSWFVQSGLAPFLLQDLTQTRKRKQI